MPEKCHEHNLEVENWAPIFHVPEIITDPRRQIGITTQTVNLRPTGNSRLRVVTSVVGRDITFECSNQFGTFRPGTHKAPFTLQHVLKLRHLVNIPFPHKRPETHPARFILYLPPSFTITFPSHPHTPILTHPTRFPL